MKRQDNWGDYTPEEQQAIKDAIDVLAQIYPLGLGRPSRKAFWEWIEKMVEVRAKRFAEPDGQRLN